MCKIDFDLIPCEKVAKYNNIKTLKAMGRKLIKKPWMFQWVKTIGFFYIYKYKNIYIVVDHENLDDAKALGYTPIADGIACSQIFNSLTGD